MTTKTYRNNGAIGALLDEYERAIKDLKTVIQDLSNEELIKIADHQTKDEDCRSIQTILTHVVRAGYNYVIAIRKWLGEDLAYKKVPLLPTTKDYLLALDEMFKYNEALFETYPNLPIKEHTPAKKIKTSWGQLFDVEQLLEHAIVHILRHRRQIERFIQ